MYSKLHFKLNHNYRESYFILNHPVINEYGYCSNLSHPNDWNSHRNEDVDEGKHDSIYLICMGPTFYKPHTLQSRSITHKKMSYLVRKNWK